MKLIDLVYKIRGSYYSAINRFIFSGRNVSWVIFPRITGILTIKGQGELKIGKNVKITSGLGKNPVGLSSKTIVCIASSALVTIGDNVGISNSLIYAWNSITIEDDVMIGGGCQVFDTDFHSLQYQDRIHRGDKKVKSSPIRIKKGAFIGTSSIITKGVTIGERSIVAAGSVVVKDIPADEVWGGNPCKFLKKL